MGYRLNRKELRIIEQTKEEARRHNADTEKVGAKEKIRPYIYFVLIFIAIALAVSLLLRFTS